MRLLLLFCAFQVVFGQPEHASASLDYFPECRPWNCLNTHLGWPVDNVPTRKVAEESLRGVLPQGTWQEVLRTVLDKCYGVRRREYTNTCPGQAMLHCVVDEMINNCPEEHESKNDSCSAITSLAGDFCMFSQFRYNDLDKNSEIDRRPKWVLKQIYSDKCCNLPDIFSSSVIQECGFSSFMFVFPRRVKPRNVLNEPLPTASENMVQMVPLNITETLNTEITPAPQFSDSEIPDPLDCCDMNQFIQPSWRSECGFQLSWKGEKRLVIANNTIEPTTQAPTTTTPKDVDVPKDFMLVPLTCAENICIFKKLGIVDDLGRVNSAAYWTMLNNYSNAHPTWKTPTDKVVSKCLSRMGRDYEADCEINKLLACTFDVLTEYCPYTRKKHECRLHIRKSGCLISSSKLRPKSRREICLLPPLVSLDLASECGLATLYGTQNVVLQKPQRNRHSWTVPKYSCIDQYPSTTCLLNKMGILNKYKFLDYFGMKDRIRQFISVEPERAALKDIYLSSMTNIPMYGVHCSSQKKLLNVVDAMLLSCPLSKRVNSPQCTQFFTAIQNTPRDSQYVKRRELKKPRVTINKRDPDVPMEHFHQNIPNLRSPVAKSSKKLRYRMMVSKKSPKVKVINIEPVIMTRLDRPLVLAPVYLTPQETMAQRDSLYRRRHHPYWLHERIAQAHSTTPVVEVSTVSTVPIETSTVALPI